MKSRALVGRILYTTLVAAGLALGSPATSAQNVGFAGPSYIGSGSFPTGAKAQSKLWFHDGKWWGSLWSEPLRRFTIQRFEHSSQNWTDTGIIIDPRHNSHSDCMMDGNKLYVGSHRFLTNGNATGNPIGLYRFTYQNGPDTYTLDTGFPVVIGDVSTEMMVIEKDSTGRLWAVWIQNLRVMVTHTLGDDHVWAAPFVLPTNTTDLHVDDICSMVRFGGNKIGVMWTDKNLDGFFFSAHLDSAGVGTWQPVETVLAGPGVSEDHLNLKSSADGRVFAMLKTGVDDVKLLVRQAAGGWNSHTVAVPADGWTRPIVVLDEQARKIYAFGTRPILLGDIYEKVTSMDAIAFAPGIGTPFIRDPVALSLNDATSTKRSVNLQSGLVVLASHQPARQYWQRYLYLGTTPAAAPVASFASDSPSGVVPFPVQFTDTSSGPATSWRWDFGDGATSSEQHPTHTYAKPGSYTVTLEVSNELGKDTLVSKRQVLVGSRLATR